MPLEAKRRFTKLDTGEVSLVDTPAVKEFAVVKNDDNPEDNDMTVEATKETATGDAESVQVDVDGGEAVAKALEHVNAIVGRIENIVKSGANGSGGDGDKTKTEDTTKSDDDADVDKAASIEAVLEKAGLKGDAMKSALANLTKAGFDPKKPFPGAKAKDKAKDKAADEDDKTKTTKSDDTPNENDTPLTMDGLVDAVQKAAAFTPSRVAKLKEAADILKLVLEAIAPNATPATRVPGVGTHPNPSKVNELADPQTEPVIKDEGIVTAIKSLTDLIGKLGERVEGIEKARNGTNSADENGDTNDSSDTVDTEKALWKGVL